MRTRTIKRRRLALLAGAAATAEQKDVLAQLQKAYPAAGLTLTEGETEEIDLVVAPLTS